MTHFVPSPTLDREVAARFLLPHVDRLTGRVAEEARRLAPGVKVWLTMRDERVRTTHRLADGQAVPDNLRFRLHKAQADTHGLRASTPEATGGAAPDTNLGYAPGWDLARYPGDPDLPVGQRINCRCQALPLPEALRAAIHADPATLTGTEVRGRVTCTFPRAGEAEYGTDQDTGAHFMAGAIDRVATETRAGR